MTALDDHLITALQAAVPLHMLTFRDREPEQLAEIAQAAATIVGTHGDDLQYGGRHCKDAFNALARGLAATALTAWGGVTIAGTHWCPVPHCKSPDGWHPRPEGWRQDLQHRPVNTLHLPDEEAA